MYNTQHEPMLPHVPRRNLICERYDVMKCLTLASLIAVTLLPTIATAAKTTGELERELEVLKSENKRIMEQFDIIMDDVEKLSVENSTDAAGAGHSSSAKVNVGAGWQRRV